MKQFVSYLLVFFLLFLRNRSNRDKKKKPKIVTRKASKEKKTHTKKKECKIFSVCFIGCKRLKTHSCSIQYEAAKVCADTTQLFRVFAFNERSRHLVSRLFCIDCFIIWVCSLRTNTNKPLTHSQNISLSICSMLDRISFQSIRNEICVTFDGQKLLRQTSSVYHSYCQAFYNRYTYIAYDTQWRHKFKRTKIFLRLAMKCLSGIETSLFRIEMLYCHFLKYICSNAACFPRCSSNQ